MVLTEHRALTRLATFCLAILLLLSPLGALAYQVAPGTTFSVTVPFDTFGPILSELTLSFSHTEGLSYANAYAVGMNPGVPSIIPGSGTVEFTPFQPVSRGHIMLSFTAGIDVPANQTIWIDSVTGKDENGDMVSAGMSGYYDMIVSLDGEEWEDWTEELAPTCDLPGREVRTSSLLRKEYREIPAHGHAYGDWEVVTPATYETEGLKQRICSYDPSHVETEVIPKLEIVWSDWVVVTPATYEAKGLERRVNTLDENKFEEREIPIKEIIWGEWVVITPATYEVKGLERRVNTLDENKFEEREIDILPIIWGEWTVITPATYEEKGLERRVNTLDENKIEEREIPIKEIVWGDWVIITLPTYEAVGKERRVNTLDAEKFEERDIPMLEIFWSDWVVITPATYEVKGLERRENTSNPSQFEDREIPIKEIIWGDWVVITLPTYEAVGKEHRVNTLDAEKFEERDIPMLEIFWSDWVVVTPPTYEAAGLERRENTSNPSQFEEREIPIKEIIWGEWTVITPPTYEEKGLERRVNTLDEQKFEERELDILPIIWGEWTVITPPTYESAGLERRVNTLDKNKFEERQLDILPIVWGEWTVITPPTYEEKGLERRVNTLDEQKFEERQLDILPIIWGEWIVITPATYEAEGKERRVNTLDAAKTEERAIPQKQIIWGAWFTAIRATCDRPGLQRRVNTLDADKVEERSIPATGHMAGDWEVAKLPSFTEEGRRVLRCSVDGSILKTEAIPVQPLPEDLITNVGIQGAEFSTSDGAQGIYRRVRIDEDGARSYRLVNKEGTIFGMLYLVIDNGQLFPFFTIYEPYYTTRASITLVRELSDLTSKTKSQLDNGHPMNQRIYLNDSLDMATYAYMYLDFQVSRVERSVKNVDSILETPQTTTGETQNPSNSLFTTALGVGLAASMLESNQDQGIIHPMYPSWFDFEGMFDVKPGDDLPPMPSPAPRSLGSPSPTPSPANNEGKMEGSNALYSLTPPSDASSLIDAALGDLTDSTNLDAQQLSALLLKSLNDLRSTSRQERQGQLSQEYADTQAEADRIVDEA